VDDEERARDAVIDVYQRLRRVAGLEAQPARVVALARPRRTRRSRAPKHRLDVRLMQEAQRVLNSESHHEWVVVLAQTACEVYVRDILDRRAAQLGEAAVERVAQLPSCNLDNERVRSVFEEMTGYTPPEETESWSDYQAHVQRRHRIVHAGARVTRADAESSIRAAEAMIAFLHWPEHAHRVARWIVNGRLWRTLLPASGVRLGERVSLCATDESQVGLRGGVSCGILSVGASD